MAASFRATVEVPPGVPPGLIETIQLRAVPLEGGEPIVIENSLMVVPVLSDLCPGDLNGDGEIDGQDVYCCAQVWDERCAGMAMGLCATE